jgi:hypothetical protein
MNIKTQINLVVNRPDGRCSEMTAAGDQVTPAMLDAAEDLLHTLTTGERPLLLNLYDVCARAFGTTREDAKRRLMAAMYGKPGEAISPTSVDQRRIADGDRALALPDPESVTEIYQQLAIIFDGMAALQSLDDLGEEGNLRAAQSLRTLEARHAELTALVRPPKVRR